MGRTFEGERHKLDILKVLAKDYPFGGGGSPRQLKDDLLSEGISLHRDTIYTLCKDLIDNGYLHKEGGKRGKYLLTDKAFKYRGVGGFLFGQKALLDLRNWKSITINNKLCNRTLCRKIVKNHTNTPDTELPKNRINYNLEFHKFLLFEFANRIGAYITYVMIEALNPDKSTKDIKLTGKQKNALVRDWLDNAISSQGIFEEFEKIGIVRRQLKNPTYRLNKSKYHDSDEKWLVNSDTYWSPHDLNQREFFENLVLAFRDNYPDIYRRLEKWKSEAMEDLDHRTKKMHAKQLEG